MSIARQLIPIACPHGIVAGNARLSVFLSPRILGTGTLAELDDWKNWPAVAGSLTFTVFTNLGTVPPNQISIMSAPPDSTRWGAVFASTTPITAFQFADRRSTPFRTFGEVEVATDIVDLYADTAIQNPTNPPSAAELLARPLTSAVIANGGGGPEISTNVAATDNYQRRIGPTPVSTPAPPSFEFHQALSLLGRHPHVMQVLGMVVEIQFPMPLVPPNWVSVATDWETIVMQPALTKEVSPRTALTNDFWPAARRPDSGSGFIHAGDGNWGLVSLDVQTAVRRLVAFTRELGGSEDRGALPALDDAGLSLARTGRGARLNDRFADDYQVEQDFQAAATTNDDFVYLFHEDLTQGYRVDVDRNTTGYLSLFARRAPDGYHFPTNPALDLVPPEDEGWVGNSLVGERLGGGAGGSVSMEKRLAEAIARWRGWSLAAPPIANVIDPETKTTTVPQNDARVTDPVQFSVTYRPSVGSLPRLTYGYDYRMRLRAVDLAGNSRTLADGTPGGSESPSHVYARYAPLPAPVVVRRLARPSPGVGDTTERIVIKSNYNTPYALIATNERLLFPPASNAQTCERHGLPNGGLTGASADYQTLVDRDGRDVSDQAVVDPASGELVAGTLSGDTVVAGATKQTAEYLPDPAGIALCLANVPGSIVAGGVVAAPLAGTWPSRNARRLIVRGAAGGRPTVGNNGGPITIRLPKAAQQVVELSLAPGPVFVEHFKLWQEILSRNPASLAALKVVAEAGRHWMISSRKRIKLVHAVRQPLEIPSFDALDATRPDVGSKQIVLSGVLDLNRPSTGRSILSATWTDPIDDPAQDTPGETTGAVVLGTQRISVTGATGAADLALTHDFVDAKRHEFLVSQEAFTRFARDFSEDATITFTTDSVTLDAAGVLAALTSLAPAAGDTRYLDGIDYTIDAAAGTVTRVDGGAITPGASVYAVFVSLPLSRRSDEVGAAPRSVLVPNAKIPAALLVHSLIPAYAREIRVTPTMVRVTNNGQVVRCYLERPWYDTGSGEQLGVVIDATPPLAGAIPIFTRYGRDAILATGGPETPTTVHFARGTAALVDGVAVVGHDVAFDGERKQWFTDIEVDADLGYRSFVRFSLARYQPEAIAGAHISEIADQEPMLLGVKRTVTVRKTLTGIRISVKGPEHEGRLIGGDGPQYNEVVVQIERFVPEIEDPDLGWEADVELGFFPTTRRRGANATQTTWSVSIPSTTLSQLANGFAIRAAITEREPFARGEPVGTEFRPVLVETLDIPSEWVPLPA